MYQAFDLTTAQILEPLLCKTVIFVCQQFRLKLRTLKLIDLKYDLEKNFYNAPEFNLPLPSLPLGRKEVWVLRWDGYIFSTSNRMVSKKFWRSLYNSINTYTHYYFNEFTVGY